MGKHTGMENVDKNTILKVYFMLCGWGVLGLMILGY
jgi:hypothetical protein